MWARSEPESGLTINVTYNCHYYEMVLQLKPYHISEQGSTRWDVQPLSTERLRTLGKAIRGLWKFTLGNQPGRILDIFSGSVSWFEKTLAY